MDICHTCDNPPCCNPMHLFEGTRLDNVHDMRAKGRHEHGERHHAAVVPQSVVEEARRLHATGLGYKRIGEQLRVSQWTVRGWIAYGHREAA